jgi:hypothetical protein
MTIQTHSKTQDLTKTMSDCRLFLKPENVLTIQDLEISCQVEKWSFDTGPFS